MLRSNKIIDPDRVRALMASMQPPVPTEQPTKKTREYKTTANKACEMIVKTGCSVKMAAQSWKVPSKVILAYAKQNNITVSYKPWEMDIKAKDIVARGTHTQNIQHGMKQRIAYELAMKLGVSEACRRLNVCRRGVYYYCVRYNLPTPDRSTRRNK